MRSHLTLRTSWPLLIALALITVIGVFEHFFLPGAVQFGITLGAWTVIGVWLSAIVVLLLARR